MKPDDREMRAAIRAMGFVLVRDKRHCVWRHTASGATLVTPSTVGKGRGFANALAQARQLSKGGDGDGE